MQSHWSWSHSLNNYVLMFDLTTEEFTRPILDIAAGSSSFNSEMTARGYKVVSCDPIYATPVDQIEKVAHHMTDALEKKIRSEAEQFNWGGQFANIDELIQQQHDMADIFCRDFPKGLAEQRYLPCALPHLTLQDFQFSLAVCANFIFDGSKGDDLTFQLNAIREICRVAEEVRIYPLLNQQGQISSHLGPIIAQLQLEDYGVEVREVSYQFFKQGNAMLRVFSRRCAV